MTSSVLLNPVDLKFQQSLFNKLKDMTLQKATTIDYINDETPTLIVIKTRIENGAKPMNLFKDDITKPLPGMSLFENNQGNFFGQGSFFDTPQMCPAKRKISFEFPKKTYCFDTSFFDNEQDSSFHNSTKEEQFHEQVKSKIDSLYHIWKGEGRLVPGVSVKCKTSTNNGLIVTTISMSPISPNSRKSIFRKVKKMHNQNPGVATIDYVNDETPTVIVIKSKTTQNSSFKEKLKTCLRTLWPCRTLGPASTTTCFLNSSM